MDRPYTICYLNCSADGHIDGEFMRSEEFAVPTGIFRQKWLDMDADCTVYGAVTMAQFADGFLKDKEPLPPADRTYPREDYLAPCDAHKYYLAINTRGTVAYGSNYINARGRGRHGIIHVLTENISDDYLAYLRRKEISYIFCGREKLDPVLMMQKAYTLFGIRKAIISGGAYADWTLLEQGLIDEMITMFNPVVDGNPAAHGIFLRSEGMPPASVGLKLVSTEITEGDGLLVTYIPKNVRPND